MSPTLSNFLSRTAVHPQSIRAPPPTTITGDMDSVHVHGRLCGVVLIPGGKLGGFSTTPVGLDNHVQLEPRHAHNPTSTRAPHVPHYSPPPPHRLTQQRKPVMP